MNKSHQKTLTLLFSRPVSGNVKWSKVRALLVALGVDISEREGSRVGLELQGRMLVLHKPHPSPDMNKASVEALRNWLRALGIAP